MKPPDLGLRVVRVPTRDRTSALPVLSQAITLARRLETELPRGKLRSHKNFVGFGFVVRQRRLAQAIRRLGTPGAYEGRMLLRTMIEIQINYAWIRAQRGHSRALRFMAFEALERLQVAQELFKTFGMSCTGFRGHHV